jgi:Ni,Fe-hydrogenase III large subunit
MIMNMSINTTSPNDVASPVRFHHVRSVATTSVPNVPIEAFRQSVIEQVQSGRQLLALFGTPAESGHVTLYALTGDADSATISALATQVDNAYPALTPDCPQAHWFEREIAEQWGVVPTGHPWLKPIRFHHSYRPGHDAWGRDDSAPIAPAAPEVAYPMYRIEGEEVHEVAVGPVHAGVIEPGHFRFQCHGENVFNLEIALGYQHRGIERSLVGGPSKRTLHVMEQVAGDTSVGHTTAYAQILESLTGVEATPRAQAIRGIGLELERLANHTGDLGALANDVGFLPTASYCGRLRGDWLNATALICGNRFGRGLVRPGGVAHDIEPERASSLIERIRATNDDVTSATNLLWRSLSVESRFEDTGRVPLEVANAFGLVGPAARASGLDHDIRHDFPRGIYRFAFIPVSTAASGDVRARATVRAMEVQRCAQFLLEQVGHLPRGPIMAPIGPLAPGRLAVSLVEGWRGAIVHVAITDNEGRFAHYKIVDPSFRNWIGLSMALRDQPISDFPLCNKSFNLSYCGHDL